MIKHFQVKLFSCVQDILFSWSQNISHQYEGVYDIILTWVFLAQDRSWGRQAGQMEAENQFPEFPRISKSLVVRAVLW